MLHLDLQPDTIPISALNTLVYCPRRFYYQVVQVDMLVNEFVLEGTLLHQRVHQHEMQTREGIAQTTRQYLRSEELHLSGFADVIEKRNGTLIPIEYKHGREGGWLNDAVQLCAQALCLEELLTIEARKKRELQEQPVIPYGYIYYASSHRRARVDFTEELRMQTRDTITQALAIASREQIPPPLDRSLAQRCMHCSLQPLCLPEEVKLLQARGA